MQFFIVLLLFTFSLGAIETPHLIPSSSLASSNGLISTIVDDSVCVITGEYIDSETDLILPGPEPLVLGRNYSSGNCSRSELFHGWQMNHSLWIEMDDLWREAVLTEGSGAVLTYKTDLTEPERKKKRKKEKKDFEEFRFEEPKGLTNCFGEEISARSNLRNQKLEIDSKNKQGHLHGASKDVRFYINYDKGLILFKHVKLNGQQIAYNYGGHDHLPEFIVAQNAAGNLIYSCLHLTRDQKKDKIEITANDGRFLKYKFKRYECFDRDRTVAPDKILLDQVKCSDKPDVSFTYLPTDDKCNYLISSKILPNDRVKQIEYYKRKDGISASHPTMNRVKILKAPVGNTKDLIATHSFAYSINSDGSGFTDVHDANNNKVRYHYDRNHHLSSVVKFEQNEKSYSVEEYVWGIQALAQTNTLLGKILKDKDGKVYSARYFSYDAKGNILGEHFYGNLTGLPTAPIVSKQPIDQYYFPTGGEVYKKRFSYTDDDHRLLKDEWEEVPHDQESKKTVYEYLPNKDLISAKFFGVYCKGKFHIKIREFYKYNEFDVIEEIITDDGNSQDINGSFTERKITRFKLRKTYPVGEPEEISELYVDNGIEKQLKRTHLHYTQRGEIERKDFCDAEGNHLYSESWEYDSHGNIKIETDGQGNVIERKYDDNDNLIREIFQSTGLTIEYVYDCTNRLLVKKEIYSDGHVNAIRNTYDLVGNCISTTDESKNATTLYDYDEFNRVIKITGPTVQDENGNTISPKQEMTYDIAGNVVSTTNDKYHTITTEYNSRDKPTKIIYPDATVEQLIYNLDGTLRESIAPNGSKTVFTYDYLDRIIKKEIFDISGNKLSKTSSKYDAFHLLETTDAEGNITQYEYDCAGRLKKVTTDRKCAEYEYDSKSNVALIKERFGYCENEISVKAFVYDHLNQLKEERIEEYLTDEKGNQSKIAQVLRKQSYVYDTRGNRTHVYTTTEEGTLATVTDYNDLDKPFRITDPLNKRTVINYSDNLLEVETIDPLGNKVITSSDALGRVVSIVHKNSLDITTAEQHIYYDSIGNRCKIIDSAITNGVCLHTLVTEMHYNSMNQLIDIWEDKEGSHPKHIEYEYNSLGQRNVIIKPDGTKIHSTYNENGLLSTYSSFSDDKTSVKFGYQYIYDRNHQVKEVEDLENHTFTRREYDSSNNILKEELGNGQTLIYTYDLTDRLKTITLSDGTGISYTYDAAHLKEVSRLDTSGNIQYTHKYTEHDLSGNNSEMKFANGTTQANHFDSLHRVKSSSMPTKIASDFDYDFAGNLKQKNHHDSIGTSKTHYTYDDLYQLTSENDETKTEPKHTYEWDSLNNRLAKDANKYTVNTLNQLIDQTNCHYIYDDNGNLKSKQQGDNVTTYKYDPLDRLIEVDNKSSKTTYTYDAFNRRLSKTVDNKTIQYIYQGQNEIGAVQDNKIIELRLLGTGKGAEIGAAVAIELNHTPYIPLHDIQGSVIALLNMSGNLVETYRYTAFGESEQESIVHNPWRFSSKRYDPETGFIYFGRRYYDPETGRWVTPDPEGFVDGPNLYAYVHNNPLTHFDLYGLFDRVQRISLPNFLDRPSEKDRNKPSSIDKPEKKETSRGPLSKDHFLDLHDDDYFDRQLVRHYADYARGMRYGAEFMASAAAGELAFSALGVGAKMAWSCSMKYAPNAIRAAGNLFTRAGSFTSFARIKSPPIQLNRFDWATSQIAKTSQAFYRAESVYQRQLLQTHLKHVQKYGTQSYKRMINGRIRYYGEIDAATTKGEMMGRRLVREWDPQSGLKRTWHETLDENGIIRIVRPETNNGAKIHYFFDSNGSFGGIR